MMTLETISKLIESELHTFSTKPEYKNTLAVELKILLDKLIRHAEDLYFDETDTDTEYASVWFSMAPHFKELDHIEIQNIFQLYYILDLTLYANAQGGKYIISANYRDYTFVEIVDKEIYTGIYSKISKLIYNADIFDPFR